MQNGEIYLSKRISDAEPRGRSENTEFHNFISTSWEGEGWEKKGYKLISCPCVVHKLSSGY